MAKKIVVGRVSTQGWAITPEDKVNAIFKNYQEAAESSSTLYAGHVRSLAYRQFMSNTDPRTLAQSVKEDLEVLLQSAFPEGVVVNTEIFTNENKVNYDLEISGTVTDKGRTYNISKYIDCIAIITDQS